MPRVAAVQHVCTECGTSSGRWLGRCPGCGEFGTMVAEAPPPKAGAARAASRPTLRLVDVVAEEARRIVAEGRAADGHLFNLGHGVLPQTDPDVLTRLVELVHTL